MIRLDGALRASKSKYAEIFMPDLKVDYYLDNIIKNLSRSVGASSNSGPVPMFIQAFQKLKVWHQYRQAGGKEFSDAVDPSIGLGHVERSMNQFAERKGNQNNESGSGSPAIGRMGSVDEKLNQAQNDYPDNPAVQQPKPTNQNGMMASSQGFDTHGGSWLTNASVPIDASMFENQDWNFSLEDWNNFEASMVQPAGGSWLGYLL